jgi:radical SAM protein with 4Fe4S-binding SPASM domain
LTFSLEDLSGTSSSGHQNKRVRAIIENCLRLRAKLGLKRPRVTVQIVLLPETIKTLKEIVEWACRSGVDHLNISRVNRVLDPELPRPDLEEEQACFHTLRSLRKTYPLRIDCFQDQIYPGILGALYRRLLPLAGLEAWCVKWSYYIYIDIRGDIFPCSGLFPPELSLGNIFTHRLPDIWNGPRLRTLRSSKARKIPCRFCDNLRLQMRTSPGYKKIKELIQAGNMN